MRPTSVTLAVLVVLGGGCSKRQQPQPSPVEVERAAEHIKEQEQALANAEAEERAENTAEALNEIDRNVQIVDAR